MNPPTIERRLTATAIDSTLLLLLCAALFYPPTHWPGAALLALLFLLELLTTLTPGKLLTHLRVVDERDQPPPVAIRVARASLKFAPIILFVIGRFTPSVGTWITWILAAILAQVYATVYYFSIVRQNKSAFDLPFVTRIVRRVASP